MSENAKSPLILDEIEMKIFLRPESLKSTCFQEVHISCMKQAI